MYFILLLCFLFYFSMSVPLYLSTLGFSLVSFSFPTYLSQGPLVLFLLSALVFLLFVWLFGTFDFLPGCFSLPVLPLLPHPDWIVNLLALEYSFTAMTNFGRWQASSWQKAVCFPFVRPRWTFRRHQKCDVARTWMHLLVKDTLVWMCP